MSENIILKKDPKIEFQLLENGFTIMDTQTDQNCGLYSYSQLQSIELSKLWFPRLAQWLRIITWIMNGVPFFPNAESCKKAKLIIRFNETNLGIWLTDSYMAGKAKKLKEQLEKKLNSNR